MPTPPLLAVALLMVGAASLASADSAAGRSVNCPGGTALLETFELDGAAWAACEDLQQFGGAIALVEMSSAAQTVEWFSKTHEQYGSAPTGSDDDYYLNLTMAAAVASPVDVLAVKLLSKNYSGITWELVASAVPPIRTAGVRAFVGSRGSVADTTFNDAGEDAAGYGFPPAVSYVFNQTNAAEGGGFIVDGKQYINASRMAEGLVGGHLPIVAFYYPVVERSPYLPPNATGSRYWTMIASPSPDMQGSREQTVWFRYQQIECAGTTGVEVVPPCTLIGRPQYWDTYWWTRSAGSSPAPDGRGSEHFGPVNASSASGFYGSLLENRRWWERELAAEGMQQLNLPSPRSTNGSHLVTQMQHNIINGMITWYDTWGPRYGVLPGYGIPMQNGFQDTFTATAMGALEVGAMPYATGLIDHQMTNYVRYDGMINYRAEEVAQQARMLTILALFHSYSGGRNGDALLLKHFQKAKTMADWLIARRAESLQYDPDDPRYGIPPGTDEGDDFKVQYLHQTPQSHWYASIAEMYRAFAELGEVWEKVGQSAGRKDVSAHGTELRKLAPKLYHDLHASMNKTVNTTASPGHRCYPHRADGIGSYTGCNFRSYSEMFYSGALTAEQTDAIYTAGLGLTTCEIGRFLTVGSPSGGTNGHALIFVHIPQGLPFGLLTHDMVERFLLYFFTQSAHSATRGTFTTPESQTIDRTRGGYAYASPGQANVPMALKWMLCFEEPETRTLWLAKATPRDWLAPGEEPLRAFNLTTRYGRISYSLSTATAFVAPKGPGVATAPAPAPAYSVHASVHLPPSFVAAPPNGGIRLRIRAPVDHAGKLSHVTIGGEVWSAFNAAEETIDISSDKITAKLIADGLPHIVASFSAAQAVPLRAALFDPKHRVTGTASETTTAAPSAPTTLPSAVAHNVDLYSGGQSDRTISAPLSFDAAGSSSAPSCIGGMSLVETFTLNTTIWVACEDLQHPGGSIALISSDETVKTEWFTKSYEPYGSNVTDSSYYIGVDKTTIANASTDLLAAKLLQENHDGLSWAAVARAVPPIRLNGHGGDWGTNCKGVRNFVGSRGAAFDTAITDLGETINAHGDWDGCSEVMQFDAIIKYNTAVGAPQQTYDVARVADGIVGEHMPTAFFHLPMLDASSNSTTSKFRAWTKLIVPVSDMKGNREQNVWSRFQQIECSGANMEPPCKLVSPPMYWDTYWFSRFPGVNASDTQRATLRTGPVTPASASGFYQTLLENRHWWNEELAAEGMQQLSLPSSSSTNGTWLAAQALHAIVKSMITRESTFQPRAGLQPGYGYTKYNGGQDLFVATATAALEVGAIPYAQGLIDNQFRHYVRADGMIWHSAESLPTSARMLTVLALQHTYSDDDGSFALRYFSKAKALAELLTSRHTASLRLYDKDDPRYGIPSGDNHDGLQRGQAPATMTRPVHWYASGAELYRACIEMGKVWAEVGKAKGRADVAAHGAALLELGPQVYVQLHASLNASVSNSSTGAGVRCWPAVATGPHSSQPAEATESFRGYSQLLYSGALSSSQVSEMYSSFSDRTVCGARLLVIGSPTVSANGAVLSSGNAYGLGYGLLQYDHVEPFLLHYFAMSAHGYNRGSFVAPESSNIADRDVPATTYSAVGEVIAPTYLKWMLCFEEPETRTLWLAKATPRDWLAPGEEPLRAFNLTTRYGRISYSLSTTTAFVAPKGPGVATASAPAPAYSVHASVHLPPSFVAAPPNGGIRLRIRAPVDHAGKLSHVTIGGEVWSAFNAAEETIDISSDKITAKLAVDLATVVASF